jgi:hypothetical protein
MRCKKAQVGVEYLIIIGLVTFVVSGILLMAFYYSNTSQDTLKVNQLESFGNKIISSAETVFYYGSPAKSTINVYLPEGVSSIEIIDNNLVIGLQTNSGLTKRAFTSKVPISGSLSIGYGLKKIKLEATESGVIITKV